MRYCYVVTSLEIAIVSVYSSAVEAIEEAGIFIKRQGVIEYTVKQPNEWMIILTPVEGKYDTYEKVIIERHEIK